MCHAPAAQAIRESLKANATDEADTKRRAQPPAWMSADICAHVLDCV
jgi:hypothetical protein